MKYGVDYGVKIDWSAYTKRMRWLCRIPILNLFFTEKFRVDVTVMCKNGPVYGTFATLRFPKSKKFGVYHIISSLNDGRCGVCGVDYTQIFVSISRKGKRLGSSVHPLVSQLDVYKWSKYYVRKDEYKKKLMLDAITGKLSKDMVKANLDICRGYGIPSNLVSSTYPSPEAEKFGKMTQKIMKGN